MIHRYHLAYYQQVTVYFWPILFFELWRVDRWTAETGRRAFVQVDRYGRAWVPWFEGMSGKPHLNGVYVQAYKPSDVDTLCPRRLADALIETIQNIPTATFPTPRLATCIDVFDHNRTRHFDLRRDPGWSVPAYDMSAAQLGRADTAPISKPPAPHASQAPFRLGAF